MSAVATFESVASSLKREPKRWVVTGAAGFIGSHLTEHLLRMGQHVVGLDDFSTGHRKNLLELELSLGADNWSRFRLFSGSVCDADLCAQAFAGSDFILHQAALGSVPRSIEAPYASHVANVDGFLTALIAARDANVRSFVFASSSSVYGDSPQLPKQEAEIGRALSPYAATKRIDELYSDVFALNYKLSSVALRYFNVFGPRQDPNGAYAAVIPRWIQSLLEGRQCEIHGDGETSRDFCFVENVVRANILSAVHAPSGEASVLNIALGGQTSLNQLFSRIVVELENCGVTVKFPEPKRGEFRAGDIRHSLADIERARRTIGFAPVVTVENGLRMTVQYYLKQSRGGFLT